MHVLDGQEVHGEIDLLWYTAPDTCVLVDFKNYPGRTDTLLDPDNAHYAGHYAPQLNAYRDARFNRLKNNRGTSKPKIEVKVVGAGIFL